MGWYRRPAEAGDLTLERAAGLNASANRTP